MQNVESSSSTAIQKSNSLGIAMIGWLAIGLLGIAGGLLSADVTLVMKIALVLCGIAASLLMFFRTEWAAAILAFIVYARVSDVLVNTHGAPSLAKYLIPFLATCVVARWLLGLGRPRGLLIPFVFAAIHLALGIASLLVAENVLIAQENFGILFKNLMLTLVIICLIQRTADLQFMLRGILLAGLLLSACSMYQFMTKSWDTEFGGFATLMHKHIYGDLSGRRAAGPVADPNFYAQILVVLIPIAAERCVNESRRFWKVFAAITLLSVFGAFVLTYSRGGIVALGCAAVVIFFRIRPRLTHLVAIAVVCTLALPLMPAGYLDRMKTLTTVVTSTGRDQQQETSFKGRTSELLVGWQMFLDHPVFGVGLGNYSDHYLQYARRIGLERRNEQRSAHSRYLEVLAETGIVGFLVHAALVATALAFVFRAAHRLQHSHRKKQRWMIEAVAVGLIAYLAAAIFLHDAYPRYFWLFIGIALSAPRIADDGFARYSNSVD